jgi:arylsulfatase A-like enzyme
VPIIISNPRYFPKGVQTNALASLVDIMPTLASLANVPDRDKLDFKGVDLTPIIVDAINNPTNPTASVQDNVLFMFDDDNPGCPNPQYIVKEPCHIRCIRDARYKYVVYFNPCDDQLQTRQHELYDLVNDPTEYNNMANPDNTAYYNPALALQMQAKLDQKMAQTGVTYHPNSPFCTIPSNCPHPPS